MKMLQKFILFSFLMVISGLNAVHKYSRNDPEAYIHADVLKNKQIDVHAVLHEAKERGLTAKNLIEIKKIERWAEAYREKVGQAFEKQFFSLSVAGIVLCAIFFVIKTGIKRGK